MQPLARLIGRYRHGLTPWRRRGTAAGAGALPTTLWSETWRAPEDWVAAVESGLRSSGNLVRRGGDFDDWDLELRGGVAGGLRLLLGVEDHGAGKQLLRLRSAARVAPLAHAAAWAGVVLGAIAAATGAWPVGLVLLAGGLACAAWSRMDQGHARRALTATLAALSAPPGAVAL